MKNCGILLINKSISIVTRGFDCRIVLVDYYNILCLLNACLILNEVMNFTSMNYDSSSHTVNEKTIIMICVAKQHGTKY